MFLSRASFFASDMILSKVTHESFLIKVLFQLLSFASKRRAAGGFLGERGS